MAKKTRTKRLSHATLERKVRRLKGQLLKLTADKPMSYAYDWARERESLIKTITRQGDEIHRLNLLISG